MSKVLVKFGGTRVGDYLHAIPLFKALKDKNFEVHAVHGRYESQAAELLQHIGLIDKRHATDFIVGIVNSDMTCIVKFLASIGETFDEMEDYDAIIQPKSSPGNPEGLNGEFESTKDLGIDFQKIPWACTKVPDVRVGNYVREDDYIGVQAASISRFKIYAPLYVIPYPGDVKSFGFNADRPVPNAIQIHGKTLIDVYEELMTCCMVVSTHSAIGVLAFYLGIPQIFIHFWEETGGANLAKRENTIQIHAPGKYELQEEIEELYKKLN
jgi:ADP-heptose:LPS heptosyltransferase